MSCDVLSVHNKFVLSIRVGAFGDRYSHSSSSCTALGIQMPWWQSLVSAQFPGYSPSTALGGDFVALGSMWLRSGAGFPDSRQHMKESDVALSSAMASMCNRIRWFVSSRP